MVKLTFLHDRILLTSFAILALSIIVITASPAPYRTSAFIRFEAKHLSFFVRHSDGRPLPLEDLVLDQVGSSEIIGPTVDSFGLSIGRTWQASPSQLREKAISAIRNRLQVHRTTTHDVWELQYTSRGTALDQAIFNDLISQLTKAYSANALQGREVEEAQHRLEMAANDGVASTSGLLDSVGAATTNNNVQRKVGEDHFADLRDQMATFAVAESSAALNLGTANADADVSLGLSALQNERDRLAAEQAELSSRYGTRHPKMLELLQRQRQLGALIDAKTQLQTVSKAVPAIWGARARRLHRSLNQAQFLIASNREEASRLAQMVSRLQEIMADYKTILAEYLKAAPSTPLHVIAVSQPSLPEAQSPTTAHTGSVALALIAASVTAARAAVWGRRRGMFDTSADVQRALGMGVLATIPKLSLQRRRGKGSAAVDLPTDVLITGADQAFEEALKTLQDAFGIGAEGLRPQVVAICSALPNEGKTTVSACFARSAAMSGCRVLLIDCDGRHAALSALFSEATGQAGLVQLLRGDAALEQAMVRDPLSGAYVIRHSSNSDIQDLSTPTLMKSLLDDLRARFDLIILDTAPILALTEARIIAANSDNVLLVARWRKTPIHATRLAVRLLDEVGARVKGVALTLVKVD